MSHGIRHTTDLRRPQSTPLIKPAKLHRNYGMSEIFVTSIYDTFGTINAFGCYNLCHISQVYNCNSVAAVLLKSICLLIYDGPPDQYGWMECGHLYYMFIIPAPSLLSILLWYALCPFVS